MKASPAQIQRVKQLISDADRNQFQTIFLTSHDDIDHVSVSRKDEDGELQVRDDQIISSLIEEQSAQPKPTFGILSILPDGFFLEVRADYSAIEPDDATLAEAIEYAMESRQSFYEQRAEEFGPDAWPTPEEHQAARS